MSIKSYLLDEKVNKQEINDALNNTNVIIGAEFEFTIPAFEEKYKDLMKNSKKMDNYEADYNEYEEALENWINDPDNYEQPDIPKYAKNFGYTIEDIEDIPSPSELYPKLKTNRNKNFRLLFDEFIKDHLPFDNYIFSETFEGKSTSSWVIKPDGSLGMSGMEIVTPLLTLKEFFDITPKMFAFINKYGKVGEECGFHISMSLKNIKNLGDVLDVTKLCVFLDEGYIYNFFESREFNTYAKSSFDAVRTNMIAKNSPEYIEKLVDERKLEDGLKKKYSNEHYMAINIEHLHTSNEYIEFKYIGGKDYNKKWDRIKTIIAHYVYNLSLACDKTYKEKEYHHKLSRILNKINLLIVSSKMTEMIYDDTLNPSDIEVQREWKKLWDTWYSLKIYYDAIKNDLNNTSARKGFERLCIILGIKEDDILWDFSKFKYMR